MKRPLLTRLAYSAQRGFTLIEVAIVLVVIGLIVSGGLLAVSPVIQSAKMSETKQKIATVESALLAYVIANGCLPCPAGRGSTATGVSNNTAAGVPPTGDYTTACAGGTCFGNGNGLVPWVTLGLSQNDASDGWSRRLTYAVNPTLTDTASADMWRTATSAFPTVTTPLAIVINNSAGANQNYSGLAYVLVSHGADGAFGKSQTGATGVDTHGTAANSGQRENGDNDLTFVAGTPSATGTGYFDDFVSFKAVNTMILGCGAGSCNNPS